MNPKFTNMDKSFKLLIVISIIAILAGLLLPSLARAKRKAKIVVCASNQKQISLATTSYMDEFDGHFPAQYGTYSWDDLMASHLGINSEKYLHWNYLRNDVHLGGGIYTRFNTEILKCPLDTRNAGNACLRSYVMNEYRPSATGPNGVYTTKPGLVGYSEDDNGGGVSTKSSQITKPSETLMLTDRYNTYGFVGIRNESSIMKGWYYWRTLFTDTPEYTASIYHDSKGRANVSMADGSVEERVGTTMIEGYTSRTNFMNTWLDHTR